MTSNVPLPTSLLTSIRPRASERSGTRRYDPPHLHAELDRNQVEYPLVFRTDAEVSGSDVFILRLECRCDGSLPR
jgi:hypothetical protein